MQPHEYVVLVNDQDQEIGVALKSTIHTDQTPLHRAFSMFVFNAQGKILVTQRAQSKLTWPGTWSNSFCGHPAPGETREAAIIRRGQEELGIRIRDIQKVADYRYCFTRDLVMENEICPIYKGIYEGAEKFQPNPVEVENYRWIKWSDWLTELSFDSAGIWSPWCKEEVKFFK